MLFSRRRNHGLYAQWLSDFSFCLNNFIYVIIFYIKSYRNIPVVILFLQNKLIFRDHPLSCMIRGNWSKTCLNSWCCLVNQEGLFQDYWMDIWLWKWYGKKQFVVGFSPMWIVQCFSHCILLLLLCYEILLWLI
jgi:hypothetical protein